MMGVIQVSATCITREDSSTSMLGADNHSTDTILSVSVSLALANLAKASTLEF